MNYLDFEEPIRQLREQLEQAQNIDGQGQVDMQSTVADLELKIDDHQPGDLRQSDTVATGSGFEASRPPVHPRPHRSSDRGSFHGTARGPQLQG